MNVRWGRGVYGHLEHPIVDSCFPCSSQHCLTGLLPRHHIKVSGGCEKWDFSFMNENTL